MRTSVMAPFLVLLLVITSVAPVIDQGEARSVHATRQVDMLPQGDFSNAGAWQTVTQTSFTEDAATYTEAMVADDRLTMVHQREVNLDTITVWAGNSPTNSNYSIGAPDGASTWSSGPEIELTSFDVSGLSSYELVSIRMKAVIQMPEALQEDTVRISVQHTDGFDLLKTFAHTQGNLDYINNSAFEVDISELMNWTWSDVTSMVFTLDYVAAGGVDDTRLVVDALGLAVTVRTPWYGGEVAAATTTFSGHPMPVMSLNISNGTASNLALSECGLAPSVNGTTGTWTSDVFLTPPEQRMGRVHLSVSNGEVDSIGLEYSYAAGNTAMSAFAPMLENTLLPVADRYQLRVTVTDACLNEANVDVNDPTMSITGRVFGNNEGLNASLSRWLVFVNDEVVSNQPMALGSFAHSWPVGQYLQAGETELDVEVKAWFTWDSDGLASETVFEVSSVDINGGYDIEWDENPVCQSPGDQTLTEDGGGIILPLLRRCSDDRTAAEDLSVTFTNTNNELVQVDLLQGDIRIAVTSESSGQSVVGMTVMDAAGNTWDAAFTVVVNAVDDPPTITEFAGLIPAELDIPTQLNLTVNDVDSTALTASTNRSWASVDLENGRITVTPPVPGFQSVLVSVCDQSSCTNRTLDLEVMALADLLVESIDFGDSTMTEGAIIEMRVLVRNQGQADATGVSVRCETEDQVIGVGTVPILRPGELGSVVCDWQIPTDTRVVRFTATVDRGLEIPEGDETNNVAEELVAIQESVTEDGVKSGDDGMGQSALLVLSSVAALALLALIGYMMPPKIKKIE